MFLPPKIAQKGLWIQNMRVDVSFQKEITVHKSVRWLPNTSVYAQNHEKIYLLLSPAFGLESEIITG